MSDEGNGNRASRPAADRAASPSGLSPASGSSRSGITDAAHTPGPWVFGSPLGVTGPTSATCGAPFCGGEDWPYSEVTCGQDTVALVPAPDDGGPHVCGNPIEARGAANARLIAAAPELLEALGWFVADERFQVAVGGNPTVVERIIADARAVYAKATGGAS